MGLLRLDRHYSTILQWVSLLPFDGTHKSIMLLIMIYRIPSGMPKPGSGSQRSAHTCSFILHYVWVLPMHWGCIAVWVSVFLKSYPLAVSVTLENGWGKNSGAKPQKPPPKYEDIGSFRFVYYHIVGTSMHVHPYTHPPLRSAIINEYI